MTLLLELYIIRIYSENSDVYITRVFVLFTIYIYIYIYIKHYSLKLYQHTLINSMNTFDNNIKLSYLC